MSTLLTKIGTAYFTAPRSAYEASTRYRRIAPDAISGEDLRQRETELISQAVKFMLDERIEIIYRNNGQFETYFDLADSKIVGVTNQRIFQIEKGIVTFTYLRDIAYCSQRKRGHFWWDFVVVHLNLAQTVDYPIYFGETAEYFVKYINAKLELMRADKS